MRIYRRANQGPWWCDFWHQGQRVRRSTGTENRKAAEEYADQVKHQLWRSNRLGERPSVSWDVAVIDWLESHQHLRTIETRKDQLRWATKYLKGKALATIDHDELDRLGKLKAKEGVANATVNRTLAAISAVLGRAVKKGWLTAKPPTPKRHEPETKVIWASEAKAQKLVDKLPSHLAAMARFTLAAGPRQHNVTHLEWSRVNIPGRIAWAEAASVKGKKVLQIHLNDAAIAVLLAQKGKHRRWVFPYRGGAIDNPNQVAYKRAVRAAGLPKQFDWHALRHTWASWHVQRGTSLKALQELGGWASVAMVEKYAHLGPSHLAAFAANSGLVQNRAQSQKNERPRRAAAA